MTDRPCKKCRFRKWLDETLGLTIPEYRTHQMAVLMDQISQSPAYQAEVRRRVLARLVTAE